MGTKWGVGYAYWRVQEAVRSRTVSQPEYLICYSICRDLFIERMKEIKSPSSPPTPMTACYRLRSQPLRCMMKIHPIVNLAREIDIEEPVSSSPTRYSSGSVSEIVVVLECIRNS